MKILMVLTSHDKLGNTGRKTGFWLEELAAPYFVFKDAGAEIVLASPKGGQPPLDPKSNEASFQTDLTHRFEADAAAKAQLASTVRLDSVKQEDYDTVFYPGGHGPMWDIAEDQNSIKLIEAFVAAGKPVALVCHAPGALRHVKTPDGKPLPMLLEPHPGGRWFRDLGGDNGHLWGFVQSIKRPVLLEIWGPLFMSTAATSNLLYRLTEADGGSLITFTHRLVGPFPEDHRPQLGTGWAALHARVRKAAETNGGE